MTVLERHPQRCWTLEGCNNFRDLGGHRTGTGATVRWQRLFRSDSLSAATSADRARLAEVGLAAVIDLRAEHEVALAGRFRDDRVAYHHVPLGDLLGREADWAAWRDPTFVARRYFELCLAGGDAIAEVMAILTDPASYPAVVHCSLGKDRTGIVVAVLLRAIGVPVVDVVDEYASSGPGARRLVAGLQERMGADAPDLDPYIPALLSAEPATMRELLRLVDDEFGSVIRYLGSLGVGSAVDYLRAALVV